MWRSTAGDGTTRIYLHDRNGQATLTLSSDGADLSGVDRPSLVASLTTGGGTGLADAVTTLSVYDARGLAEATREPGREHVGETGSATTATIVRSRTYNAFGEVASETDARGHRTDFSYNAMGRLIETKKPEVSYTSETGAADDERPTETYTYDIAGRLIAVKDANGNETFRTTDG